LACHPTATMRTPPGCGSTRSATPCSPPPSQDADALDLAALRATAEQASRLRTNGHYRPVAVLLPDLLIAARAATAQDNPEAWVCLARAYQVAVDLIREVGERELALLIADRYVGAGQRSGDALLIATSRRHLGFALLDGEMLDTAGAVCSDAADAITPSDATAVEGWSVWGSLRLAEAIIAARAQDRQAARRLLDEARAAAVRVGPGRNDYWQAFGPANVGLHEVHVALQLDDPVEALRIADAVEVDQLPVNSRRAAYCIDVAHAHSLRRSDSDAATVAWLQAAYRYAPDRVRTQVLPRELVRVCRKRERCLRTPELRGLAEQLGIAD
jgi:hypothetical protein